MATKLNLDVSERLDITCKKGDTFNLGLLLKDSAGTAITLVTSNYEFLFQVKSEKDPVTGQRDLVIGTASKGKRAEKDGSDINFVVTTDDSGNATFTVSSSAMELVDAGRYAYDIQQIVGDVSTTILEGRFVVNDDISNLEL
tara:strand:- start:135 stop:560 length:426 start_codon:yes stop_codon:yes gene_type:complete